MITILQIPEPPELPQSRKTQQTVSFSRLLQLAASLKGWIPTGYLSIARAGHTATLLSDGRVLVAGGYTYNGKALSSAEIYDPTSARWSTAASMHHARSRHAATRLDDGRVLVAGGYSNDEVTRAAETYDPAADRWTIVSPMNQFRMGHTLSQLDTNSAIAVGGLAPSEGPLNSSETYRVDTDQWELGSFLHPHCFHAAALAASNRLLISGGYSSKDFNMNVPDPYSSYYFDSHGPWFGAGNLNYGRAWHTATTLADETVLAVGGISSLNGSPSFGAELFDPNRNLWFTTPNMHTARALHTATKLPDETVLVVGGFYNINFEDNTGDSLSVTDLYQPKLSNGFDPNGIWTRTNNLIEPRGDHTATLLPDGTVLVAGGIDFSGPTILDSAERFYTDLPDLSGCTMALLRGPALLLKRLGMLRP